MPSGCISSSLTEHWYTADITAAKKIIQKRKELEGIDTGNVILEPRSRRATAAAPKYDDSTSDTDEEEDGEANEDDEDEEDGEGPGTIGTPFITTMIFF